MKKKNRKNKLILTAILGSFTLVSVMTLSNYQKPKYESAQASIYEQKAISYDDNNNQITFSLEELSYTYTNLASYFVDNRTTITQYITNSTNIVYNTENYGYLGYTVQYNQNVIDLVSSNYNSIKLTFSNGLWTYTNNNESLFEYGFTLSVNSNVYEGIKTAVELDIEANQPVSQGDTIINAVASGMGLIPDIAQEFVKGFTAIFWDSTNSSLTRVSNFMLVMLGIAIVMAIIKLSLMLIRNNTGA